MTISAINEAVSRGHLSDDPNAPTPSRSIGHRAWLRIIRGRASRVCLVIVAIYVLVALASFTPFFARKIDNGDLSADQTYAPPKFGITLPDGHFRVYPSYWLGLDIQGRSVFWRVLYGCRMALIITVCTSALVIAIGAFLGLAAGYFGGWVDDLVIWLFSTVSSIPWLLLVIALAYVIQNGIAASSDATVNGLGRFLSGTPTIIVALVLTDWVGLCRLMRGEVLKLRDMDFVIAARAIGAGHTRIIFRHILPNTMHLIIISLSLGAISYVQAEVILAFLGLGITDKPSWGRMIDDSKLELLRGVWWEVTAATVAIFVLCLALSILGDLLRDAMDPRLQGAK